MAQNLETFYGLRLRVARDIELKHYESMRISMDKLLDSLGREGHEYGVYVSRIKFTVCENVVFKVGPIRERLEKMNIKFSVNPKDRQSGRIFFLNHKLNASEWLLSRNVEVVPKTYEIRVGVDGDYCHTEDTIELLVLTCVKKDVPHRSRKIKISATAHPTPKFAKRFRGSDGKMTTDLDYLLDSQVQLLLKFGPEPSLEFNPGNSRKATGAKSQI